MKKFKIDINGIGKGIECVLTPLGEERVKCYLTELAAKRKEILDAGKDTADITWLPSIEDIISDIEIFFGVEGANEYYNSWGVTDSYIADYPLRLTFGEDIITEAAAKSFEKNINKTKSFWEITESLRRP